MENGNLERWKDFEMFLDACEPVWRSHVFVIAVVWTHKVSLRLLNVLEMFRPLSRCGIVSSNALNKAKSLDWLMWLVRHTCQAEIRLRFDNFNLTSSVSLLNQLSGAHRLDHRDLRRIRIPPTMTRGNQRDKAREKNLKAQGGEVSLTAQHFRLQQRIQLQLSVDSTVTNLTCSEKEEYSNWNWVSTYERSPSSNYAWKASKRLVDMICRNHVAGEITDIGS